MEEGFDWVWACRSWVRHKCGHAEEGFDSLELEEIGVDSLELGVGMQRWSLNWVLACRVGVRQPWTGCGHEEVGFDSCELGVGMQRWGLTSLN